MPDIAAGRVAMGMGVLLSLRARRLGRRRRVLGRRRRGGRARAWCRAVVGRWMEDRSCRQVLGDR